MQPNKVSHCSKGLNPLTLRQRPVLKFSLVCLAATLALQFMVACNGPQITAVSPQATSGKTLTPPPIPVYTPQTIPSARPGNVGGTRLAEGALAPAPAAGGMAAPGSGAVSDAVSAPAKVSRPTSPAPGTLPVQPIRPEAGLLTAGEWDDTSHWSFWLELLKDNQYKGMGTLWGFDTRQRVSVKVMGPQGPLVDVPVRLQSKGATTPLFEARTNQMGMAFLYLDVFAKNTQISENEKLTVTANLGRDSLTRELSPSESEPVLLTTQTVLEPAINADLMLVVDTTGSMGDELDYLKKELQNVAQRISASNRKDLTLRLSANFYKDTTDEYVVRPFPFTTDIASITRQLGEQSAGGGGDFPEAMDAALANAVDEHQWSPTARARLLFLVCDAPAHQSEDVLKRLHISIERAAAKGIRVIPVASSGIDKETEFLLRMLAISTGGRYVFLTSDSGIGGEHIQPTIGEFQVQKLNDLMVKIANDYLAFSKPEPNQTVLPKTEQPTLVSPMPEPSVNPEQPAK